MEMAMGSKSRYTATLSSHPSPEVPRSQVTQQQCFRTSCRAKFSMTLISMLLITLSLSHVEA